MMVGSFSEFKASGNRSSGVFRVVFKRSVDVGSFHCFEAHSQGPEVLPAREGGGRVLAVEEVKAAGRGGGSHHNDEPPGLAGGSFGVGHHRFANRLGDVKNPGRWAGGWEVIASRLRLSCGSSFCRFRWAWPRS